MVCTTCRVCSGKYHWDWADAFNKFGFDDGDGQIETHTVEDVLENLGYRVEADGWGFHNTIITSIKKDGIELIPNDVTLGYDNPRDYLPEKLITLLDEALPPTFAYIF